jgi:16S rRNA C967 or C1407 C5-methylase (RsmB/RsmF family)
MTEIYARYRPIVEDWPTFQAALQRPLPTTIWANPLKITAEQLAALLPMAQPLAWHPYAFRLPADFSPGLHWGFATGLYHAQEEVSLLPVTLLDPQPGERILDLCAAPGNKTALIATQMRQRGTVVANDRNAGRMFITGDHLQRLGLANVITTVADGVNYPAAAGLFDKVLVDAPCSCEGNCRKDPDVMQRSWQRPDNVQKALLRKAVHLCLPGGRILYATCTFAPEENELVVAAILAEFGDQLRLRPARVAGFVASPGITRWHGRSLPPDLANCMRVWPHQNDTGGFFIALLEKMGERGAAKGKEPEQSPISNLQLTNRERTAVLRPHLERFGMEPAVFDDYHLLRWSKRQLYLLARTAQPPSEPPFETMGLPLIRTSARYPKLTTAAAMAYGRFATQNLIDIQPEQAAAFLARQDITLSAAQQQQCSGTGYVLIRYHTHIIGVGVYRAHLRLVESHFPKSWVQEKMSLLPKVPKLQEDS